MSVSVNYAATVTVAETLDSNVLSAPDTTRVITHTSFNETAVLHASSTPPVNKVAEFLLTLTAGSGSIDLRSLTGTNGASVDGNGLKVQVIRIKNLGENPMTFIDGATNGYPVFGDGNPLEIPVGGHIQLYGNDKLPDVSSTAKIVDVTGTGSQTAEVTIVLG